jgi:4-carboxymuconolactone decarboxylase
MSGKTLYHACHLEELLMRLTPLTPDHLNDSDRAFYDLIVDGIAPSVRTFDTKSDDGALIGPFSAMLHFPQFGRPTFDYTNALVEHSTLPKGPHEVAILVVGTRFNAQYEIYAHERVAAAAGLSAAKIATISAGGRPTDLTPDEAVAYDVASELCSGGPLAESTYQAALGAFGETATAELVYLIGGYCLISIVLNAYDVSVPTRAT